MNWGMGDDGTGMDDLSGAAAALNAGNSDLGAPSLGSGGGTATVQQAPISALTAATSSTALFSSWLSQNSATVILVSVAIAGLIFLVPSRGRR